MWRSFALLLLAGCVPALPEFPACEEGLIYPDLDNDGYGAGEPEIGCLVGEPIEPLLDCDDADPAVNPGATEVCDGVDNDCDAEVDEGVSTLGWADGDNDGFGSGDATPYCDGLPAGVSDNGDDCDDTNNLINPGQLDNTCNGVDDDCDTLVDEAFGGETFLWWLDADGDGQGDASSAPVVACQAPTAQHVRNDDDCDDTDSSIFVGATDDTCDGVDQDCDSIDAVGLSVSYWFDGDNDQFGDATGTPVFACDGAPVDYVANDSDCDDTRADINPDATEVCDGVDNDCDLASDEGLPTVTGYFDRDQDGYGAIGAVEIEVCEALAVGLAPVATDCDDNAASVNPGQDEVCDGLDNECSGVADDGLPILSWWPDADEDGFGDGSATPVESCGVPAAGGVNNGDDCDDAAPTVYAGAPELCDGLDNDCDTVIDNEDLIAYVSWWPDADGDGFGDPTGEALIDCSEPLNYAANDEDCDDSNDQIRPGVLDTCDGVDSNCSGVIDSDATFVDWLPDLDQDGFGDDDGTPEPTCDGPPDVTGWADVAGDCDDTEPSVAPDLAELCDGLDNDCDALVDNALPGTPGLLGAFADVDGDGFGDGPLEVVCPSKLGDTHAEDAGDCDDSDALTYPGATEDVGGADRDCDGCVEPLLLRVPADYADASVAVAAACDGGEVELASQAHVLAAPLVITRGVTVRGLAGASLRAAAVTSGPAVRLVDGAFSGASISDAGAGGLSVEGEGLAVAGLTVSGGIGPAVQVLGTATDASITGLTVDAVSCPVGAHAGGALSVADAVGFTLDGALISDVACQDGGAVALVGSLGATLTDVRVNGARANGRGGALFIDSALEVAVNGLVVDDASAVDGGAVSVIDSLDVTLSGAELSTLVADASGAALSCVNTTLALDGWTVDNALATDGAVLAATDCTGSADGLTARSVDALDGALVRWLGDGSHDLTVAELAMDGGSSLALVDGCGVQLGGLATLLVDGVRLRGLDVDAALCVDAVDIGALTRLDVSGSTGDGARLGGQAGELLVKYATIVGHDGDGLVVDRSLALVEISHAILAYNGGFGLRSVAADPGPDGALVASANVEFANALGSDLPQDAPYVDTEPPLIGFFPTLAAVDWTLQLRPQAQPSAWDLGPTGCVDADGSPCDAGAFAGPGFDATWYADADVDGLPDGWEQALGGGDLLPTGDEDGDGLDNLGEYAAGSLPTRADTDGDGALDGADAAPLDASVQ